MRKILLSLIALFLLSLGFSQQDRDSVRLKMDTGQVLEIRDFDGVLNEKYKGGDFLYDRKDGEAQNLLALFLSWALNGLQSVFGIDLPPYLLETMEYLLYFFMGILAIYLLVRFFVGENWSSLFTKKAEIVTDINLSETHIDVVDLDVLIQSAVMQGNFRLAVRYHYLKTLKLLSQKGLIEWHYEKTNMDYLNEIGSATLKSGFREVSYIYDHIWYGEKDVDAANYQKVQMRFTDFKNFLTQ